MKALRLFIQIFLFSLLILILSNEGDYLQIKIKMRSPHPHEMLGYLYNTVGPCKLWSLPGALKI